MSGNGSVWGRVRSRLRAFPECLAACGAEVSSHRAGQHLQGRKGRAGPGSGAPAGGGAALKERRVLRPPRPSPTPPRPQAAAYGRCVQASMAPGGRLRKDLCAQEFQALRSCFAAAVSGRPHPDAPPSPVSGDLLAFFPLSCVQCWVCAGSSDQTHQSSRRPPLWS